MLLLLSNELIAQQQNSSKKAKPKYQVWEFMTRSTMTMKIVAKRFHVEEKVIKKLSKYRKKKVYPATVLRIPVLVREPIWNPESYNPNQPILPAEDARTAFEYEWNSDKLDPQLKEDFIILREVKEDSAQLEKLHLHISALNNSITIASKKLDSIKATEFSFEYDSADINSVLSKMQRARDNYYAMSPIGREIDSLSEIRVQLGDETQRIQNRLNEFEYLNENAEYYKATKGGDRAEVDTWTKRVIAESKYEAPSISPKAVASNLPKNMGEKTVKKPEISSVAVAQSDTSGKEPRVHSVYQTSVSDSSKTDVRVHTSYQAVKDTTAKPQVRVHSTYSARADATDTMTEAQKKEYFQNQQIERIKLNPKMTLSDEDFMSNFERNAQPISDVAIASIKVEMQKEQPKYMIPVDAATKRKADGYIQRFKEAIRTNDLNEAVRQLEKSIATNPHNASAWCWHAELQAATGHSEDAIKEFTIAQSIEKRNARPAYKLGVLYENANNLNKANEYFIKAMHADSSYTKAIMAHARISQRQGNIINAITDYNKLLSVQPNYVVGYKERAQLEVQARDFESAVDDYTIYLGLVKPDGETLYRRGLAKAYVGKSEDACADFSMAKALNYAEAQAAMNRFCK